MTLTIETPFRVELAGPLDSQTANPVEAAVPLALQSGSSSDAWVSASGWRDLDAEAGRRKAREPRAREVQQYLDDERHSRIEQARALVRACPQSSTALARLAQVLLGAGEPQDAEDAARSALRLADLRDDRLDLVAATARFVAARVLVALGHPLDAENILGQLPGEGPWTLLYAAMAHERGEHDEALARLVEATSADALAFRGFLRLEANEPTAALSELRAAQALGAGGSALLLNLAYAFACIGAPRKAIRAAQQATALAPRSRHASFNLASYLRASGRSSDAVAELRRLRSLVGEGDPQVAAAIADAYSAAGDERAALRELRRAQHHNSLSADSPRLAELKANTALLEWRLGQRNRQSLVEAVREQIRKVGGHLSLVLMLADLSLDSNAASDLRTHYKRLLDAHPEPALKPLLARILLLEGDLEQATRVAREYADRNPLDLDVIRSAVILRAQVLGEYGEAADVGLQALRRAPGDLMLRNNVAFCLALAHRASEAYSMFKDQELEDPYLLATRGLIDIGLGRVVDGMRWYDRAAEAAVSMIADKAEAEDFVLLLRTQEWLSLQQLAPEDEASRAFPEPVAAVVAGRDDSRYAILRVVMRRLGNHE